MSAPVPFVITVMELWDRKKDTADMAAVTGRPEHICALALRIGREQRREKSA